MHDAANMVGIQQWVKVMHKHWHQLSFTFLRTHFTFLEKITFLKYTFVLFFWESGENMTIIIVSSKTINITSTINITTTINITNTINITSTINIMITNTNKWAPVPCWWCSSLQFLVRVRDDSHSPLLLKKIWVIVMVIIIIDSWEDDENYIGDGCDFVTLPSLLTCRGVSQAEMNNH